MDRHRRHPPSRSGDRRRGDRRRGGGGHAQRRAIHSRLRRPRPRGAEAAVTFLCAVCAHTTAMEVVSFPSYPAFLVPLPRELARDVARGPLTLSACRACGHFQVADVDPELQRLLYEVYYRYYEVDTLETMVPAYRDPFNRLVESLAAGGALPNGHLLEIGCSSGAMIPFLTRFCRAYTGVDPSERIEIARQRYPQHAFVRSYFPAEELRGTFDVA